MAADKFNRKYQGILDCFEKVTKEEGGTRGLYRGFGITLAGIIPYRAFYFGGYDFLKKVFLPQNEHSAPFFTLWFVSQLNTISSQYLIYPLDTVRRHMIIHGAGEHKLYNNSIHCIQHLYHTGGGLLVFYRGSGANAFRATGGALCMVFYDKLKMFLRQTKYPNQS